MLGFAPDLILAWCAAAGIVAAIFGARTWALYFIAPAMVRWVLWPIVEPYAGTLLAGALIRWWWFVPIVLLAPIVAVILGIRLFVDILEFFFGPRVAGHVGGVFVTRIFDWISGRNRGRPIPHWEPDEHE